MNFQHVSNRPKDRIVQSDYIIADVIGYGADNLYPQNIRNITAGSPTAKNAVNKLQTFLVGNGFEDETTGETVVNKSGETLDDLLEKVALDVAQYNGYALHLNYNGLLQVVEIQHVPFEYVRLASDEACEEITSAYVWNNWDGSRNTLKGNYSFLPDRKEDRIDLYTDDRSKTIAQIVAAGGIDKWKGQLVYVAADRLNGIYPLSPLDSVRDDARADAESQRFRLSNIRNNFVASQYVKFTDGMTDDAVESFKQELKKSQGSENAGGVMIIKGLSEEQAKNNIVEKVDVSDIDKLYQYTDSRVDETIIRAFGQPPALHGKSVSGSGAFTSADMIEAFAIYNQSTRKKRKKITKSLEKHLQGFPALAGKDLTISPLTFA